MRSIVSLAMLMPAMVLASALQPMTVLPQEDGGSQSSGAITRPAHRPGVDGGFVIGIVDTVGGTTYDWQSNGPAYRQLINSPEHGIHVAWMFSASDQTTFPDRNMRYNFYDYSARVWNWADPDFMQSGVNVYTVRSGFGNMDADPATGVAFISAHNNTPIRPVIARDMAPGGGLFEYCDGSPNCEAYQWPYFSVGSTGTPHVTLIDEASADLLFYSKVDPWCTFSSPVGVPAPQPDPLFPNQNIAASKLSQKVCITWVNSPDGATSPNPGFYRISTDGGSSWQNPEELPWPDAYGGDSLTSFHITSLHPFYDKDDNLHVAANVMPFVGGQGYIIPAQIWHWSAQNSPNWSMIHWAGCDPNNLGAAVGYNASYACRPSLGTDANGNLFVAWEQFDSANVEIGPPERLRADIFYSHSSDNGQTWAEAVKITDGGTVTHRFPSILDWITDTVAVAYLIDQHCGFYLYAEGPATNNPVVVQKWENPYGGAVKEQGAVKPHALAASASPNPFARAARVSYALPRAGQVSLAVYDAAGRPVRVLARGRLAAGQYSTSWDGRDDQGRNVAAGVYLYKLVLDRETVTGKLLLTN
ncbi:MAG: FlgD immunoglobulin-like domain containing protein [bacterium]